MSLFQRPPNVTALSPEIRDGRLAQIAVVPRHNKGIGIGGGITNKWKRQHLRKALYLALAEKRSRRDAQRRSAGPLAAILAADPRILWAHGGAGWSFVRRQFRRHNRIFRVDVGKGGIRGARRSGNPTHPQSEATWPQMFWSP